MYSDDYAKINPEYAAYLQRGGNLSPWDFYDVRHRPTRNSDTKKARAEIDANGLSVAYLDVRILFFYANLHSLFPEQSPQWKLDEIGKMFPRNGNAPEVVPSTKPLINLD